MKLDFNSTSERIITHFDYKTLSPQQRKVVEKRTGEIKERLRRTAQDVWEVGQKLVEVRSQLEYGQFEVWLSAEFGWSRRTAYNFINVYETFGESTNFAQLDIATSALYKLAAPSTPESIRHEFLDKAEQGQKITHKQINQALKIKKTSSILAKSQPISLPSTKILQVIPKDSSELELKRLKDNLTHQPKPSSQSVMTQTQVKIKSGCWYLFDIVNVLFCGDTALAEFYHRAPEASLAIAVTSDDWDHDWLIEKADNLIVLKESYIKEGIIEQIISLFSAEGDTIILPWLPKEEMLAIAHHLNRRIVAGDPDPERCQKAIDQLGLNVEQIRL